MKKAITRTLAILSAAVMITSAGALPTYAITGSTPICPTFNGETPANGCIVVGMKGNYNCDIQAAIDRINAIRLEACKEGVPDPNSPSRRLTKSDYVPIKWSEGLEGIARVRAAESSIRIGHTRPNDDGCFSLSPEDVTNTGEVLAWNWSNDIVSGIEQFYDEKSDWVRQNSAAVTGHYTSMIDPDNTYVGMSSFTSDSAIYYNTVAGRFGCNYYGGDVSEERGEVLRDCVASVIVNKSYISSPSLKLVGGSSTLGIGKPARYELRARSSISGGSAEVVLFKDISWKSSDESVATVDKYGRVVGKSAGEVTITASCQGFKATKDVTVFDSSLANADISIDGKTYTYTGKALKPSMTVTLGGKTLVKGTDYKVSYSKNTVPGKAKLRVTGQGQYTDSKVAWFYIRPAQQEILKSALPAAGQIKIRWRKDTLSDGFQIISATDSGFTKNKKSVFVVGSTKTAKTLTGLKSKRNYFIKLRAYKVVDGKKIYGKCSPTHKYKTR